MKHCKILWLPALMLLVLLAACQNRTPSDSPDASPTEGMSAPSAPPVTEAPGENSPENSPETTLDIPDTVPENPEEWITNEIRFEEMAYSRSYSSDDGTALLQASGMFPKTGIEDIDRFYEDCMEDYNRVVQGKLANAQSYYEDGILDMTHTISSDYAIELNSGGLLSVSRRITTFEGGSNESMSVVCENFSLISGQLLWMDDIFTVDESVYKDRLLQSVYEVIDAEPDRFYADAKELAKECFPYESFCITAKGVSLFYSQYNIAPYTEHIVRIDVPWERISDIFNIPE